MATENPTWWQSVIIGASGGTAVWLMGLIREQGLKCRDKRNVIKWLQDNTSDTDGQRWRSTQLIATHTNLTNDRVNYICSIHNKIRASENNGVNSNGVVFEMWGLKEIVDKKSV
jgi:hypothetical protein